LALIDVPYLAPGLDAFVSARVYASQEPGTEASLLECPGYEGICILDKTTVAELGRPNVVQEMAMDAKYGTNSAGYILYAVLVELDGTGVPLASLIARPTTYRAPSTDAPLIQVLDLFFGKLRAAGFQPSFFGCDKDAAEIAAIHEVFPLSRVQLCYWHVLRAIRSKLSTYKSTSGHLYDPQSTQRIIPHLEMCWGSRIDKRPYQHRHPSSECGCPSRNELAYEHADRLEASLSKKETRCWHSSIAASITTARFPFEGGIWKSEAAIHQMCAPEMV